MAKHALLSASGASRWLVCTPSPRLELEIEETTSAYADEGTLAHELGEWLIRNKAYGVGIKKHLARIQANELYSDEMLEYCNDYADFVVESYKKAPKGAILMQEQRLNLTEFIPEGFGTVDNAIISSEGIHIIDLKYGKGVPVDAYENKQMMVYALGVYMCYDLIHNIKEIVMTIYQPRIDNTSTYVISADNLLRWAREVLKPTAKIAYEGLGELVAGEHCRFCRFRPTCKENATRNLQIAAREFDVVSLTPEQISKILSRSAGIKNWLTSVEEYALKEAIKGKKWPGMKVVQGRSTRKYTDEKKIYEALKAEGIDVEMKTKLPGIIELTKAVSKDVFEKIVNPFVHKPPGAPTLVSEEDKRPEFNRSAEASDDFS